MKMVRATNERGQALIEALIAAPALISVVTLFVLSVAIFSLRIHLIVLTQEMATCRLSTKSAVECQAQARSQAQGLLQQWGFQNVDIRAGGDQASARLFIQARWARVPLRWVFQESIPFDADGF